MLPLLILSILFEWGFCAEVHLEVHGELDRTGDWTLILQGLWEIEVTIDEGRSATNLVRDLHDELKTNTDFLALGCHSRVYRATWDIQCPLASLATDLQIGCCGTLRTVEGKFEIRGIRFERPALPPIPPPPPPPPVTPPQPRPPIVAPTKVPTLQPEFDDSTSTDMSPPSIQEESDPLRGITTDPLSTGSPSTGSPSVPTGSPSVLTDQPSVLPDSPSVLIDSTPVLTDLPSVPTESYISPSVIATVPRGRRPTNQPSDAELPLSPLAETSDVVVGPDSIELNSGDPFEESPTSPPVTRSEIEILEVVIEEVNALLFKIDIRIGSRTAVYIEYYVLNDDYVPVLRTKTTDEGTRHRLFMMRLYEASDYHFDVYQDGLDVVEYSGSFRTGYIQADVYQKFPTIIYGAPTYDFTYTARDDPGYHFIYDKTGEVVWFMEHRQFPGDNIQRKSNNNTVLITRKGHIMEITPEGRVISDVDTECYVCHHSLSFLPGNENIVYTTARERIDLDSDLLWSYDFEFDQADDTVLKIDLEAETYEVIIRMRDYLNIWDERTSFSIQETNAEELFPCNPNGTVNDWIRLNSVFAINESYIIVGSHHLQEIYGFHNLAESETDIESSDGIDTSDSEWDMHWRLSSNSETSSFEWRRSRDKFYGQHEVSVLPNGNLLLFDNGLGRPPKEGGWYSRGLEYHLDFEDMTIRSVWQFRLNITDHVDSEDFDETIYYYDSAGEETECIGLIEDCLSVHRGSLQRLDNGNTIIVFIHCECDPSGRGYVAEVNEDEELVSLAVQGSPEDDWTLDSGIIFSVGSEIEINSNLK